MSDEAINVSYTNWRGETKTRRVLLGQVRFGKTDWHTEPTWLISAFDLDHPAQIWKEFDLAKCDFNRDYMPDHMAKVRDVALQAVEVINSVQVYEQPYDPTEENSLTMCEHEVFDFDVSAARSVLNVPAQKEPSK